MTWWCRVYGWLADKDVNRWCQGIYQSHNPEHDYCGRRPS